MSLPTTFSNVLIEGNTIDSGSSFNGALSTTYTYGNNVMLIDADARIMNNYISGVQNSATTTYLLNISRGSCNIQGNTFVRGSSTVTSYINATGGGDQIIMGNVFDGYTVDGATSQVSSPLFSGTSTSSIYTGNKNQQGTAIIPLGVEKSSNFQMGVSPLQYELFNYSDFPPSTSVTNAMITSGFGSIARDAYVLKIYNNQVTPSQQYFSLNIDISKSIPRGAKVISAKLSLFSPQAANALDTGGTNNFVLGLNASRTPLFAIDVKDFFSASQFSWMNGYSSNAQLIITSGNVGNISTNYQVIEVPTLGFTGSVTDSAGTTTTVTNSDISNNYINGNDYNITATLNFSYKAVTGTSLFPLLVVSPLIVTYVF